MNIAETKYWVTQIKVNSFAGTSLSETPSSSCVNTVVFAGLQIIIYRWCA